MGKSRMDTIRETGIKKMTVYRWWNEGEPRECEHRRRSFPGETRKKVKGLLREGCSCLFVANVLNIPKEWVEYINEEL